jgi:hypothetical protein
MDEKQYFKRKAELMTMDIADLIQTAEDDHLVNIIYVYIANITGNRPLDIEKLNGPQSVVALSYGVCGIVGNGGLEGLFSAKIQADLDFSLTRNALMSIHALDQARALELAKEIFDNENFPINPDIQYSIFMSAPKDDREKWDSLFFSSIDDVESKAAKYIRANRDAFMKLRPILRGQAVNC